MKTKTITLKRWLSENSKVHYVDAGGVYYVYSRHPDLWHLDDYAVSSVVSGPAVVMVKKKNHKIVSNRISDE